MINWKVRIKNKTFWIAIIPAALLLIQQIGSVAGVAINIADFQSKALDIVNTLFVILAILGVVVDPTTEGTSDSQQAMAYEEPRNDTKS